MLDDGRAIVAGKFTLVNGVARPGIAMIKADGTLHTSFDPPGGFDLSVNATVPQSVNALLPQASSGSWTSGRTLIRNCSPRSAMRATGSNAFARSCRDEDRLIRDSTVDGRWSLL
jgi:hypothetical protein